MNALRTPDTHFQNLPDYPFAPRYAEDLPGFEGLRLHWLDEGSGRSGRTFLCLHGQPTWSYLYRKMIPILVAAGHRVIAPDFFGFGRSDKPVAETVYSFDFHRRTLLALIERLDLERITLVCQDWGGILGLTLPMDMPARVDALLVMNTVLCTGEAPLTPGWIAWRDWCAAHPDMAIGRLMKRSCPHLSAAECAAYDAPYTGVDSKAGVRTFPPLVPAAPDAPGAALSRRAREFWQRDWQGKSYMAIGLADPVIGAPVMRVLHGWIRNCPPPLELPEAGHFVQEWGEAVLAAALPALD